MNEDAISRTEARIAKQREILPPARIEKMVEKILENGGLTGAFKTFSAALQHKGLTVIAEVHSADGDVDCMDLAYECEAGDADVIAYATEPYWHDGDDSVFAEIRDEVSVPMLRRDYVIDPYQIFEAKVLGADAIVLDCALAGQDLSEFLRLCGLMRMEALVEVSDASELSVAVDAGAKIISVRPPLPGDREMMLTEGASGGVSREDEARLIGAMPEGILYVAQCGICSVEDALAAKDAGADGVLVRELLMEAPDDDARTKLIRRMKD